MIDILIPQPFSYRQANLAQSQFRAVFCRAKNENPDCV
jgi:hypothetical protein